MRRTRIKGTGLYMLMDRNVMNYVQMDFIQMVKNVYHVNQNVRNVKDKIIAPNAKTSIT
jgi:hypothetical protein